MGWAKAVGLLGVAGSVIACGASPAPMSDGGESDDALLPASCNEAEMRRVETWLPEGVPCQGVRTSTGSWVSRRLFPDAPETVRDRACRFTWRAIAGSSPNVVALAEATLGADLTASCRLGSPPIVTATSDDGGFEGDGGDLGPILPMGGSVGCDVCGVLDRERRKVWVVRPPNVDRIRFQAQLADQAGHIVRYESLAVPDNRAPSVVVSLPAPPEGLNWVDGPISLRRY